MPELPEVEATCQAIRPHIMKRKLTQVIVRQPKLRWAIPKALSEIKNTKIIDIQRRAKYILLTTSKGTIIIHLGMSGRLRVLKNNIPHQKHDHVDFIFNDGALMRYTDPRRFGSILFTTADPLRYPLLAKLGPEPFSESFNAKYLFEHTQRKNIAIKQLIMDQQVVAGVGNIYANEALFLAKLSPLRSSRLLMFDECQRLVEAIQEILKEAIRQGGTTLRDFLSPDGKPGYFVQKLFVYGRENKNCLGCHALLSIIQLGQRSTVFCKSCQK